MDRTRSERQTPPKPYYDDGQATLWNGDARALAEHIPPVDLVLTDPPYPNNAGHFVDDIAAVATVLDALHATPRFMVFWHQLSEPPVDRLGLVARHAWFRTNTNRPDNYEAIYEYATDGERPSKVFPFPVVYPGLTGCVEATGHPTQKNLKLMQALLQLRPCKSVVDPFAGSGTTLEAAKRLGIRAYGIEKDERWCDVTARRLSQEVLDFGEAAA